MATVLLPGLKIRFGKEWESIWIFKQVVMIAQLTVFLSYVCEKNVRAFISYFNDVLHKLQLTFLKVLLS